MWSAYIVKDQYLVRLIVDPGVLKLSKNDINVLRRISQNHSGESVWEIVDHTHTFQEWVKNWSKGTSRDISLPDVLDAGGIAPENKQAILDDLEASEELDRLILPLSEVQHP